MPMSHVQELDLIFFCVRGLSFYHNSSYLLFIYFRKLFSCDFNKNENGNTKFTVVVFMCFIVFTSITQQRYIKETPAWCEELTVGTVCYSVVQCVT